MKKEIWKDIRDFEGIYKVNNRGDVKSVEKYINNRWGGKRLLKEKILKPQLDKYGYLYVNLYKNGKSYHKTIHRLVAEAFVPNPDNLPCVNHKSEVKTENYAENLEWCTNTYNLCYGKRTEKAAKSKCKAVYQYDVKGNFIKKWDSLKEIPYHSGNISMCCNGKLKTAYGFKWSYAV